jgi:hypothetical protein
MRWELLMSLHRALEHPATTAQLGYVIVDDDAAAQDDTVDKVC